MTNDAVTTSLDLILRDALHALQQLSGADTWKHLLVGTSQGTGRGADHAAVYACPERHELAIISFPHRLVMQPGAHDTSRLVRVFPRHRVIVASAAHLTGPVGGLENQMPHDPVRAREELLLMVPDAGSSSGMTEIRITGYQSGEVARAVAELTALKV
ncbi:hypothetical protein [Kineosporia sp. NBRC 101731]|uniref:hypothetical protein n=1 Tax=Kineosporia sp. NBRC 101731 TaxID=3032199 RepID=UPI0024A2BB43|nr:hypothetical protein [Kineosporia sp. NBRC 101731]GLY29885.1 hypothetical protein Kisp02_32500 [Kineosporia sp. NBRC 101731]